MIEYTMNQVKDTAAHLRTLGAYVQQPVPGIVGLDSRSIIGSQDAKSLYPTIVVLLNIGYDTFRGRIYDFKIIGNLYNFLIKAKEMYQNDNDSEFQIMTNIRTALYDMAKDYYAREKPNKISAKDFREFTRDYYADLFRKIVKSKHNIEDILVPREEEHYYLQKSCLFPLLEAITWMSAYNKGHSNVCVDWVFAHNSFETKYQDREFLVLHNINSVKSQFIKYNMKGLIDNIFKEYLITPYGTYFEKHKIKTSFECPLILNGMDDRSYVKNQMLIEAAIVENWDKLSQKQQGAFLLSDNKIDKEIAKEIIEIVGDNDPKVREWQLSVLSDITFNILAESSSAVDEINKQLDISVNVKTSKSNSIKVTLNSGYGLNGLLTWAYGNNLIANSITTGGKIYGIKLFQQLASNVLRKERKKIEEGVYEE